MASLVRLFTRPKRISTKQALRAWCHTKRGPHGPHKIQSEVLAFLIAQLSPGEPIRARELAKLVQQEFGIDVHPRTIERAVGGKKTPR